MLLECNRKRTKLAEFMQKNKSMSLIKECRELMRMNQRVNQLKKRSEKQLSGESKKDCESPGLKDWPMLRSIDSLDDLEESDLSSIIRS